MDDSDKLLLLLDKINDEYNDIVNTSFDGIHVSSGGLDSGFNFRTELSSKNWNYRNSKYFYPINLDTRLIHFTKIERLFSILSEQAIRLYSLSNSNDEKEYNHTAEMLGISSQRIQNVKDSAFTFSLCNSSEIDDHKMWQDYAHSNGKEGCCIIFKICNNPLKWKNFHLSNVKYSDTDSFERFYKRLAELKEQYPNSQFDTTLDRLMIFHKTNKWSSEKEIRLASFCGDYEGYRDRINKKIGTEARIEISSDESKKIRYINYMTIPLIGIDNGDICDEELPHIEIDKIIVGNTGSISYKDFQDLKNTLVRMANPTVRGMRTKYIHIEEKETKIL